MNRNANTAYGQYAPPGHLSSNITPGSPLTVERPGGYGRRAGYPDLTAFARRRRPEGTTSDLFSQPVIPTTQAPKRCRHRPLDRTGWWWHLSGVQWFGLGACYRGGLRRYAAASFCPKPTHLFGLDDFCLRPGGNGHGALDSDLGWRHVLSRHFCLRPQPQVMGVSPSVGPANVNTSAAEIVTISGENFGDYDNATGQYVSTVNEVTFNNAEAGSSPPDPVLSNTYYPAEYDLEHVLIVPAHWEITVNAPFCSATNTYDVRVETSPIGDLPPLPRPSGDNLGNWSPITAADQFTYLAPPSITAVSPAGGPTRGGATVTIDGTNLSDAAAVDFGNIPATSFTVDSETQITATSPAGPASKVDVTVTTPGGISVPPVNVFVDPDAFTFVTPPVFYAMSPVQSWGLGGPLSGGTKITITGKDLASVTAVDFGSASGTNLSINSAGTQLTVDSPAESAGAVEVNLVSLVRWAGAWTWARSSIMKACPR